VTCLRLSLRMTRETNRDLCDCSGGHKDAYSRRFSEKRLPWSGTVSKVSDGTESRQDLWTVW